MWLPQPISNTIIQNHLDLKVWLTATQEFGQWKPLATPDYRVHQSLASILNHSRTWGWSLERHETAWNNIKHHYLFNLSTTSVDFKHSEPGWILFPCVRNDSPRSHNLGQRTNATQLSMAAQHWNAAESENSQEDMRHCSCVMQIVYWELHDEQICKIPEELQSIDLGLTTRARTQGICHLPSVGRSPPNVTIQEFWHCSAASCWAKWGIISVCNLGGWKSKTVKASSNFRILSNYINGHVKAHFMCEFQSMYSKPQSNCNIIPAPPVRL